jgi:hypothetical protein
MWMRMGSASVGPGGACTDVTVNTLYLQGGMSVAQRAPEDKLQRALEAGKAATACTMSSAAPWSGKGGRKWRMKADAARARGGGQGAEDGQAQQVARWI